VHLRAVLPTGVATASRAVLLACVLCEEEEGEQDL
jgi:hypothetical protein